MHALILINGCIAPSHLDFHRFLGLDRLTRTPACQISNLLLDFEQGQAEDVEGPQVPRSRCLTRMHLPTQNMNYIDIIITYVIYRGGTMYNYIRIYI
jgi:hypothetical protein